MAAYDSRYNPFIRQLEKLRKSNPSLVARIENRADEIYENYSEIKPIALGYHVSHRNLIEDGAFYPGFLKSAP